MRRLGDVEREISDVATACGVEATGMRVMCSCSWYSQHKVLACVKRFEIVCHGLLYAALLLGAFSRLQLTRRGAFTHVPQQHAYVHQSASGCSLRERSALEAVVGHMIVHFCRQCGHPVARDISQTTCTTFRQSRLPSVHVVDLSGHRSLSVTRYLLEVVHSSCPVLIAALQTWTGSKQAVESPVSTPDYSQHVLDVPLRTSHRLQTIQ